MGIGKIRTREVSQGTRIEQMSHVQYDFTAVSTVLFVDATVTVTIKGLYSVEIADAFMPSHLVPLNKTLFYQHCVNSHIVPIL